MRALPGEAVIANRDFVSPPLPLADQPGSALQLARRALAKVDRAGERLPSGIPLSDAIGRHRSGAVFDQSEPVYRTAGGLCPRHLATGMAQAG